MKTADASTRFRGAHAPSRANASPARAAGALAGMNFSVRSKGKVRFGEGAKTNTRGACAPHSNYLPSSFLSSSDF